MKKTAAAKKTTRKSSSTKKAASKTPAKKVASKKPATKVVKKAASKKPATKSPSWKQRLASRVKRPLAPVEPDEEEDENDGPALSEFLFLTTRGVDLDTAMAALRDVGLFSSFETEGAIGATLEEILLHHASRHAEKAYRERFHVCEFPFLDATDDLIDDLNGLLPGPPVCRQIEVDERCLVIERPGGRRVTIDYDMLWDVANAYDAELQRAGSPWRLVFVALPGSGCDGFLALDPPGVARLQSVGLLPTATSRDDE